MMQRGAARLFAGVVLLGVLVAFGCTDTSLQPKPPPPQQKYDDLLKVKGELCTQPADKVVFPVKILFLLDQSASLQCTDSTNKRFAALTRVIGQLQALPNVYFGFVGFSSWSRRLDFTRNMADIQPFLDPAGGLGPATDYQGALATAVQMVEQDMINVGAAVRARTKYVVVMMSDGVPEPRCNAGCEDDRTACSDGRDNDGDGLIDAADPDCANINDNSLHPDNLSPVCNTTPDFRQSREPNGYVDMQGVCPAYNQPPQILARIADLRALADAYSAGSVTLDTVLLFADQAAVNAVCPNASAAFGYDHDKAKALLQSMADAGGGTFRDVNLQRQDDTFLDFNFQSLSSEYWLTELIAKDVDEEATATGPVPDRDMDGLSDDQEIQIGTDPDNPDTDGDNYSDLFEVRYEKAGFDPLDPTAPALNCPDKTDLDGDGLNDCEESFIGADPRLPDTDGDRIPDGLELIEQTNPLVFDSLDDPDFDGILNRDEIRAGTLPLVPDLDRYRSDAVRYGLTDLGEVHITNPDTGADELRRCYDFQVSHLQLVVTPLTRQRGLNRIIIRSMEEPVQLVGSRPVAEEACIEVFYNGDTSKDPPSGEVDLTQDYLDNLRAALGNRLDDVANACGQNPQSFSRGALEADMQKCLPPRPEVGGYLYDLQDLVNLERRYLSPGLAVQLPAQAWQIFHPMATFDPATDCVRPWEIGRLQLLLQTLQAACGSCQ